jgi:DNA-binding XRE family transcriptional regulator
VRISLTEPIASLLEAAGVTRSALADALDVRRESIKDGENVKLSTLVRAAEALGWQLEVRATKKGAVKG